jgi:hypothetical protein
MPSLKESQSDISYARDLIPLAGLPLIRERIYNEIVRLTPARAIIKSDDDDVSADGEVVYKRAFMARKKKDDDAVSFRGQVYSCFVECSQPELADKYLSTQVEFDNVRSLIIFLRNVFDANAFMHILDTYFESHTAAVNTYYGPIDMHAWAALSGMQNSFIKRDPNPAATATHIIMPGAQTIFDHAFSPLANAEVETIARRMIHARHDDIHGFRLLCASGKLAPGFILEKHMEEAVCAEAPEFKLPILQEKLRILQKEVYGTAQ